MNETATGLNFEERGIANALTQRVLRVPLNQRPYAWTDDEVRTLLDDLYKAFDDGDQIYFLGAIVLTRGNNKQWEIADGQQRLVTISILIAAVRDYLLELGDEDGAKKYQSTYLLDYDVRKRDSTPKLYLNTEDHEFFLDQILKSPTDRKLRNDIVFRSNARLADAAKLAASHVRKMVAALQTSEKPARLYDWTDFLHEAAKIIIIMVPGRVGNAFKMFETLNARGAVASKTDILKNYLFELAKDRIHDVHPRWVSMLSTIESLGEDDLLIRFVRHYWISQHGPTTERELGAEIEKHVRTERQAVDMLGSMSANAVDYVALLSPRDHARWNEFSRAARNAIYTITRDLGGEQVRPLMLAVTRNFTTKEAEKAFAMMVSWSVRFLVVGGAGGGVLERSYGLRAREVTRGEITTASQLRGRMLDVVHSDTVFRGAFEAASVRKTNLARYYLRALELHVKGEAHPQLTPSEDTLAVNLEHVLPVNPSDQWAVPREAAEAYYRRLGNMVLLKSTRNSEIGNKGFDVKRVAFRGSPFVLTAEVADNEEWGPEQIEMRQARLAQLAPAVWPL